MIGGVFVAAVAGIVVIALLPVMGIGADGVAVGVGSAVAVGVVKNVAIAFSVGLDVSCIGASSQLHNKRITKISEHKSFVFIKTFLSI